jgi:pantoate--beta-alanine ligase
MDFPLEMFICPTVREADGVAMSSRNTYLTMEQRHVAPIVYRSLCAIEDLYYHRNENRVAALRQAAQHVLQSEPRVQLEYLEFAMAENLRSVSDTDILSSPRSKVAPTRALVTQTSTPAQYLVSIAVRLGHVRLIDNILLH